MLHNYSSDPRISEMMAVAVVSAAAVASCDDLRETKSNLKSDWIVFQTGKGFTRHNKSHSCEADMQNHNWVHP